MSSNENILWAKNFGEGGVVPASPDLVSQQYEKKNTPASPTLRLVLALSADIIVALAYFSALKSQ